MNLKNNLSIKNFIERSAPSRLQSIRLPRDLNLSGTKTQPKKVYKPNVNAVRNKSKIEKPKNNEKSKTKSGKEYQEKLKERFVQSTGIFSEGIGQNLNTISTKLKKKLNLNDTKLKKHNSPKLQSTNPVNKHDKNIEDPEPNNIKIEKSDSDSEEHFPFKPCIWNTTDFEFKLEQVKSELNVTSNKLPVEYEFNKDTTHPMLSLWQLPDSFASKGIQTDFSLCDMPEGQIGKISVHKSGKIEISIANTNYGLDSTLNSCSEDVVYLNSETNNIFVLDDIKNRFILSPDWNFIL